MFGLSPDIWAGAILGAVLGSIVIPVANQLIQHVARRWRESRPVRQLLSSVADESERCLVFVRDLHPAEGTRLVSIDPVPGMVGVVPNITRLWPDAEGRGVANLFTVLGQAGKTRNVEIVRMGDDNGLWNANIIVLGAQAHRSYQFYQLMQGVAYSMDGESIHDLVNGGTVQMEPGFGYGIILKAHNPYKTSGRPGIAFLLGGFGTLGTEAATYYLREHFRQLGEDFGSDCFGVVVRAPASAGPEAVERLSNLDRRSRGTRPKRRPWPWRASGPGDSSVAGGPSKGHAHMKGNTEGELRKGKREQAKVVDVPEESEMPTEPLQGVLYRELAVAEAERVTAVTSPLLTELVNYATNLVVRCKDSSKKDEEDVLFLLYIHIVEVTDAIEVLLSQSCVVAAKPLLRSSFETLLSIEYMTEKDFEQRALSYLAHYMHERLKFYQRWDPSTAEGRELQTELNRDVWTIQLPSQPEFKQFAANYASALASPRFRTVESEYRSRKRVTNWYQLFGGPANACDLAKKLNRGGQYEVLYRRWSDVAHGGDPAQYLSTAPDGSHKLRPLRDASELGDSAGFAARFLYDASEALVKKVRPEEQALLLRWYATELAPLFEKL